jgi:CRISPR-associated protein Cas2
MAHYLICYDIANPRRLGKVHRRTVARAMFVQYSVYYLSGTHQQLDQLLDNVAAVMNLQEDDVRAYSCVDIRQAACLGVSWLPNDLYLG